MWGTASLVAMSQAYPPGSPQGTHLLQDLLLSGKRKAKATQQHIYSLYRVHPNPDAIHQAGGVFITRDDAWLYSWHPTFLQFTENKTSKLTPGQIHP